MFAPFHIYLRLSWLKSEDVPSFARGIVSPAKTRWPAMAGVDLPTLKELMGHADTSTTMRYAHPTPEHKRDAVRKLERYNIEQVFGLYETGPGSPQKSPQ